MMNPRRMIAFVASIASVLLMVPAHSSEFQVIKAPYEVAKACYKVPVVMWIQKCEEFPAASSGVLVAGGSKVTPAVDDKVAPTWSPYIGMMGAGTSFVRQRAGTLNVRARLLEAHVNNFSSSSVCLRFSTAIVCASEPGTRSLQASARIAAGEAVEVLVTAETVYPGAATAILEALELSFVPDEVVGTS